MATRRGRSNPLAPVNERRWLVLRDQTSRPMRHTMLPPMTDLRDALAAERQRMITEGWEAPDLTWLSFVFIQRGNDRWCLTIECFEPGTVGGGHGTFIGHRPGS